MADKYRWVSCAADVNWSVAQDRHLVVKGELTTACGATASTPDIWRGNTTKPKCATCAKHEPTQTESEPMTTTPKFPDVTVALSGEDGNAFVIASRTRKALERAGHRDAAKEFFDEALSGNFDHVLQTVMATVTTT